MNRQPRGDSLPCVHSSFRSSRRRWSSLLLLGGLGAAFAFPISATSQSPPTAGQPETATQSNGDRSSDSRNHANVEKNTPTKPDENTGLNAPRDPKSYGLWVLIPAAVAILMTIFTRQVVPSLFVGVTVGAAMMVACLSADSPWAGLNPLIATARLTVEKYIVGSIHEYPETQFNHVRIMVFTLVIAFMVGVIGRNGGTAGMVQIVAGPATSRRRGALTAWFSGLLLFFDDYSNCMIIGPTMRPVFDRLKLSREKLAYIIDSTAAPVASIALIGTWVGTEVSLIQEGLNLLPKEHIPEYMLNPDGSVITGMQAFLHSLTYRFYPILTLLMVFWLALLDRDFGPMRQAESQALSALDAPAAPKPSPVAPTAQPGAGARVGENARVVGAWWLGFFPIVVLVGTTMTVLSVTGLNSCGGWDSFPAEMPLWERVALVIGGSDSYASIMYGAFASAATAILLTIPARSCTTYDAVVAGLDGMSRTFPAIVILVLAWGLSSVQKDLMLGQVMTEHLRAIEFPARWLPFSVFVSAALISFATGTSWGTMGVLCPITATMTAGVASTLEPEIAVTIYYATVGAVLSGAVFGDHCSPISDTTVLSSIGADCRHERHVWTQLPYAVVAAVFAMGLGDLLTSVYDMHWYYGLLTASGGLTLFILMVARRAVPRFDYSAARS